MLLVFEWLVCLYKFSKDFGKYHLLSDFLPSGEVFANIIAIFV